MIILGLIKDIIIILFYIILMILLKIIWIIGLIYISIRDYMIQLSKYKSCDSDIDNNIEIEECESK